VNYSPQSFHYQDANIRNCSKLLDLIAASIYIIYLDAACNNGAGKSISYLSMGCEIFGRLNLENNVLLADILELTWIAQACEAKLNMLNRFKGRQIQI